MNIEIIIKILTIIGSFLGAIAFFQNFSKEVTSANKEKWKKVTEIINLTDFDNLQYQISARKIRGSLLHKLEKFVYVIEKEDDDIIGFKSLFKNKIKLKLSELDILYDELRKFVQVPYWNPFQDEDNNGNECFGYIFDKKVFFEDLGKDSTNIDFRSATKEYVTHIDNACEVANKMVVKFSEIQKLANKEPYELLLPWKWN